MSCSLAIFRIKDSEDNVVNLLDVGGFSVTEWRPAVPGFKDGGVWGDSPFVDGSLPVFGVYANTTEEITLTMKAGNANRAAGKLQILRRLLRQASVFWFGRSGPMVYLEARMHGETNTRYAVLTSGNIPNDGAIFSQPGLQGDGSVVMIDLRMSVTRLHWTSNPPGTGTDLPLSAYNYYKGTVYGSVDEDFVDAPTTDGIYMANKHNIVNFTNIHNGTGGANLLNTFSPAVTLFDGGTEVLFGIDATAISGPFSSILFNIEVPSSGDAVITWEYLSAAGPTWTALSNVQDLTDNFWNVGVNPVVFRQPAFDTATSPGGGLPTGYWARARISSGSFTREPGQYPNNPYALTIGYLVIDADDIDGDIPALAQLRIDPIWYPPTRIIGGIKTVPGSPIYGGHAQSFHNFLNCADEQNTVGVQGQGGTAETRSPTGKVDQFVVVAGSETGYEPLIFIDPAISGEYTGTYRVFIRARIEFSAGVPDGDVFVTMRVSQTTVGFTAPINSVVTRREELPVAGGVIHMADLGLIDLPVGAANVNSYVPRSHGYTAFYGNFENTNTSVSVTISVYDIIIIPVDEWSFDAQAPDLTNGLQLDQYLVIDGIESGVPRAVVHDKETGAELSTWTMISNGHPRLNSGRYQRLFLLSDTYPDSPPENVMKVTYKTNQQYMSLRGED